MPRNTLSLAAILAAVVAPLSLAQADGRPQDSFSFYMEREDAERLREAGERACRQIVDGAVLLGEQFQALSHDLSRQMHRAQDQFRREVAPALRDLAGRLEDMARQLEQPPEKR